ncbi:MAG: O-Antigen ligase [Pelotomaculum sp. PtaU1.Bin035]|nr:MAG: O-Antigen ligase [Pelotomaculum sp. PtaU1.Bin035]
MQSTMINLGKNILNKTTSLWLKSFEASMTGNFTRFLRASYQESFTGRLLNSNLAGKSHAYSLLQTLTAIIEKHLKLPARVGIRQRQAITYSVLLALLILTISSFFLLPWEQALLALGAAVLTVATLYKTETGVYAAALILPFVPFKALLGLAVLTLASFTLKTAGRSHCRLYLSPIFIPLLLFFLVMFYATVTSVSFLDSASELLIPVTGLIYLLVIVNIFDRKEKLDRFIFCLAVAATITAAYAVYQYYAGANVVELKKEWVDTVKNPDIKNRAYAVFENPNLLAQYLVLLTTLSLGAILNAVRPWQRMFFTLTAALATFCLVLTYSRGGWLALVAALAVFALFKNKLLVQVLAITGVTASALMPPAVIHRLSTVTSLKDTSNAYRLDTWLSTLSLIKTHWETGVGLGRKAFARVYYTHMINSNVVPHSHNLYLQLISEFGILGLAVFCWLFLGIFRLGLKISAAGNTRVKNLNAAIMGALAGFFIHSGVDYFLWYYKLGILLWLLVAAVLVLEKFTIRHSPERN